MSQEIKLTAEQQVAFDEVINYFTNPPKDKPYWVLTGYAGVGKTTLLSEIIKFAEEFDTLKEERRKVAILTLTWKASIVLHKKGIKQAQSIHSFLYNADWEDKSKGLKFIKKSKHEIQKEFQYIIVDEASMVSSDLKKDLIDAGLPILFTGDPFQLPPVTKDNDELHFLDQPDSKLTTILRQALDNPIIDMSMRIREESNFNYNRYLGNHQNKDKLFVFNRSKLNVNWLTAAEQVICGTNATRIEKNNLIRQIQNKNPLMFPDKDEKLIALNNIRTKQIFNGTILLSDEIYHEDKLSDIRKLFKLRTEDGKKHTIKGIFTDLVKDKDDIKFLSKDKELVQLAFANVITCHKAQGSQWDKLLVFNEPIGRNEIDKRKWMYTSITRAVDKCIIIL
jgi:exodeoxyribonuclease-5